VIIPYGVDRKVRFSIDILGRKILIMIIVEEIIPGALQLFF